MSGAYGDVRKARYDALKTGPFDTWAGTLLAAGAAEEEKLTATRALFAQVNAALVAWEGGADGAFKAPGDARAFDYTRYACYTNDPNCTV